MNFCAPNNFIMLTNEMFRLAGIKEYKLFLEQLDNAKREGDIQRYIKKFSKWFIPGALMRDYDFGGMVSYLISEPALGNEYRADYMILGFNSVGPQVVLAEFEDVNVPYKISSANAETESVRKGLTQIRDWKRWLDENRNYFLQSTGLVNAGISNIPSWCFRYCLVVSRRKYMDDAANFMRGQTQKENSDVHIVTYDRLADNIKILADCVK